MLESREGLIKRAPMGASGFVLAPPQRQASDSQTLSALELWATVKKQKATILGVAATIFCLVVVYVFLKTPVYEGTARLQIDPNRSASMGLDEADKALGSVDVDSRVKTEVSIIQSSTVALQVMKSLLLYDNPSFAGKEIAGRHIQGFSDLTPKERQRLLDRFAGSLTVRMLPSSQVVEVRFRSTDPQVAGAAANSIIDEYILRNFHVRFDGTVQVTEWLSRQMEEIKASTSAAQQKLAEFQKQNNFLGADESDNIVTDRLKQLNEELTQAEADRIMKEGKYRLAKSGNPELIASVVPNTTLQLLRSQEAELQAQYAQMDAKYGDGYPKLQELQSQLTRLNSAISAEGGNIATRLANEYDAAAKAESMIRGDFEKQKAEAYHLNENVGQYAILKHEVESGQQLYDTLQLKLKEAAIASGLTSSYVSVIDRSDVPDHPVEPRKLRDLALGLFGGLFGGLLAGLLVDSFDDTVRSSDEIEKLIGLPELTSVPFAHVRNVRNVRSREGSQTLFAPGSEILSICDPDSAGAESYRSLSSMVLLSSTDRPPKILVVTSALPSEGKSTVSCNLAVALAKGGRRVLLVDADLRCSSIHERFGLSKGPGLATMFASEQIPNPRFQPVADLPNLHVLTAGFRPRGPSEVLASRFMQQLMEIWKITYDNVIIDTPPMLAFSDALVLAFRADGVILVTRSGVTRKEALLRACDVLSRSRANVLGFVLNADRQPAYYYQYPGKYPQSIGRSA